MEKGKFKIAVGFSVCGIALLVLIAFLLVSNGPGLTSISFMVLTLILISGVFYIVVARTKDVKKGLPSDDERSRLVNWKAGAYSYFATIWISIALLWYNTVGVDEAGLPRLETTGIIGTIVLLSGIIYISLILILNKKGST